MKESARASTEYDHFSHTNVHSVSHFAFLLVISPLSPQLKHSPRKEASPSGGKPSPAKCKYGLRQNKRRDSKWEDPDYVVEMNEEHPEFKKLAFTSPGPKNAFAPLKRVLGRKGASFVKSEDDSVFIPPGEEYGQGTRDPNKVKPVSYTHLTLPTNREV